MTYLTPDRLATRFLLLVLFGLLALGPFLHAHLGFSKTTGFHVAGVDRSTASTSPHAHVSDPQMAHADLTESESPAVGVAASMVRFNPDPDYPDGLTLQCVVAVIAALLLLNGWVGAAPADTGRPAKPRAGLPPPALSPPALS